MPVPSRVPDDYKYWYHDKERDIILFNDAGRGWVKWNHLAHPPEEVLTELREAVEGLQ